MDYKNDERYWNIKLLNKWFAISSIIFLLSFVWMFYHDNDDEFKRYQREFRKIAIEVSNQNLDKALISAKNKRSDYEDKYALELEKFNNKSNYIDSLNGSLEYLKGLFYKANMDYLFQKAEADGLKYLYEDEIVHSQSHKGIHDASDHSLDANTFIYKEQYNDAIDKVNNLKLIKEAYNLEVTDIESLLKKLASELKTSENE